MTTYIRLGGSFCTLNFLVASSTEQSR